MGENCNGLNNIIGHNEKIMKALDIREDLDINCLMYCKHRINFRHKENKNDLKQMFQRKLACMAVSAHNIHEGKVAGRIQQGGTGTICFGKSTGYIKKTRQDSEGLGRWCWILFSGTNRHSTQIITAYNPCKNKNMNLGTTYQQQLRYFVTKKKDLTCSIVLFQKHLVKQIKDWQATENRIILFMDHNKHVINGPLGRDLADKEGPDLREAILHHTGASPGTTFFRGSRPIDGLWISSNLDISNTCVMPFSYGIGNHRAFILDIPIESLVGVDPVKIVHPANRRLNSKLPGCSQSYIDSLEGNIGRHCLLERLFNAHTGNHSVEERAQRVININKEGKAYMRRAEKICRKKNSAVSHSPWRRQSRYSEYKCITLSSDIIRGKLRIGET
jgi:hypothetical protein